VLKSGPGRAGGGGTMSRAMTETTSLGMESWYLMAIGAFTGAITTLPAQPRKSVWGGEFIQNRLGRQFCLFENDCLEGKLTPGDPFLDSGVEVEKLDYVLVKATTSRQPGKSNDT